MSDNAAWVFIWFGFILLVAMCAGDPDLLDAIIYWLMN